jgi:hypothetical protein
MEMLTATTKGDGYMTQTSGQVAALTFSVDERLVFGTIHICAHQYDSLLVKSWFFTFVTHGYREENDIIISSPLTADFDTPTWTTTIDVDGVTGLMRVLVNGDNGPPILWNIVARYQRFNVNWGGDSGD